MVDIGEKNLARRTATASGRLFVAPSTIALIQSEGLPKGNPFEVARMAGILAAKETAQLIPLCHQINLDHVDVEVEMHEAFCEVNATVRCKWATGVEMEALTAASVALLTLYDMCKAVDKKMEIGNIRLVAKEKQG